MDVEILILVFAALSCVPYAITRGVFPDDPCPDNQTEVWGSNCSPHPYGTPCPPNHSCKLTYLHISDTCCRKDGYCPDGQAALLGHKCGLMAGLKRCPYGYYCSGINSAKGGNCCPMRYFING